jgi:uncharacterized membrane protein
MRNRYAKKSVHVNLVCVLFLLLLLLVPKKDDDDDAVVVSFFYQCVIVLFAELSCSKVDELLCFFIVCCIPPT